MRAIDILGDGWAFLVLREAFFSVRRFDQILRHTQAPRAVLADRLDRLVRNGLLKKVRYQERPERFEYRLTPMSHDLYPAIVLMMNWGDRWLQTDSPPRRLIHKPCGSELIGKVICSHCGEEISPRDVIPQAGPGMAEIESQPTERLRRPSDKDVYCRGRACSVARTLSVIGNRWAALTLRESLSGARRFDEFQACTNLPTTTLTSRLRLFVDKGVLKRVAYQDRPARYEYRLTKMGYDLYGISIALMAWGDRCTSEDKGRPLLLQHNTCGHLFEPTIVCSCCGGAIDAHDVEVEELARPEDTADKRATR
jgi:DNA-binding HxlR family transcriptional regulator